MCPQTDVQTMVVVLISLDWSQDRDFISTSWPGGPSSHRAAAATAYQFVRSFAICVSVCVCVCLCVHSALFGSLNFDDFNRTLYHRLDFYYTISLDNRRAVRTVFRQIYP